MFSKTFGYALRGILYVASISHDQHRIQTEEIAAQLGIPRFFMGKILKSLVKEGILLSCKGPGGGFYANDHTLNTTILQIALHTDGDSMFKNCILKLQKCSTQNPCPLHHKVVQSREELMAAFADTTIRELIFSDPSTFIKSISTRTTICHESPVD